MSRRTPMLALIAAAAAALLALAALRGSRGESEASAPARNPSGLAGAQPDAALVQPPPSAQGAPVASAPISAAAPTAEGERAAVAALPADADSSRPFVAGHVVDDAGAPVAGAEVAALISWEDGSEVTLATASDGAGAFGLAGAWTGATKVQLTASASERHIDASLEVVPPALDALLVLVRGGWIEGSVVGDELTPPDALRVYLDREPEPVRTGDGVFEIGFIVSRGSIFGRRGLSAEIEQVLDTDGSFRVGPLAPGKWRVRIGRPEDRTELFDARGVRVLAGETTRDPRLDPVDLWGALRAIALRVIDTDGRPIEKGSVLAWPSGDASDPPAEFEVSAGAARLITKEDALNVVVRASGYGSARVENLTRDAEVVLGAGYVLRLVLHGVPAPGPPDQLWVRLEADDGQIEPDWTSDPMHGAIMLAVATAVDRVERQQQLHGGVLEVRLGTAYRFAGASSGQLVDERGEVRYEVGEPGRYRVSWRLASRGEDGGLLIRGADWEPLETILVADTTDEQVFAVHLDAERMRRLRGLAEPGE